MGYPTTQKSATQLQPLIPPHFGVDNVKNAKNRIFHYQMIKLCGKVVPINKFQPQSWSSKCLKSNRKNCFEIDEYKGFF